MSLLYIQTDLILAGDSKLPRCLDHERNLLIGPRRPPARLPAYRKSTTSYTRADCSTPTLAVPGSSRSATCTLASP